MSSQQLFLDQVYTIGDKKVTGEEISYKLKMFDKMVNYFEKGLERIDGDE